MEGKVTIEIVTDYNEIWGNEEPDADIDIAASIAKLDEMTIAAILESYPGVKVTIEDGLNESIRIVTDLDNENDLDTIDISIQNESERPFIEDIMQRVWSDWNWIVTTQNK